MFVRVHNTPSIRFSTVNNNKKLDYDSKSNTSSEEVVVIIINQCFTTRKQTYQHKNGEENNPSASFAS